MKTPMQHSLIAYGVLLSLVVMLWLLLLGPAWSSYQTARMQKAELSSALAAQKDQLMSERKNQLEFKRQLDRLQQDGGLIFETHDAASHYLQEVAKSIFARHGLLVKRLSPEYHELSPDLFEIDLELGFQAPQGAVQRVLEDFSTLPVQLSVQLLSLRDMGLVNAQSVSVEGRLVIALLAVRPSIDPQRSSVPATTTSHLESKSTPKLQTTAHSVSLNKAPNYLKGLFNSEVRRSFSTPEASSYRVAAITRSSESVIAIIIDTRTGQSFRLQEQEFVHAWRVDSIDQTGVDLSAGASRARLELKQ